MNKVNIKLTISIALIIIILLILANNTFAFDPNEYDPTPEIQSGSFLQRVGIILGWIKYLGILIAVVALTVIGLKYMFSSVEGKAEYKKAMLPYILGCFMLVGISIVIGLIEYIAVSSTWSSSGGGGGPSIPPKDRVDMIM